jgi:hypothetical protein
MDIDAHIDIFRKEMITNKIDEEKFKIEDEFRKKAKE